jgi:hypothetical protein
MPPVCSGTMSGGRTDGCQYLFDVRVFSAAKAAIIKTYQCS